MKTGALEDQFSLQGGATLPFRNDNGRQFLRWIDGSTIHVKIAEFLSLRKVGENSNMCDRVDQLPLFLYNRG